MRDKGDREKYAVIVSGAAFPAQCGTAQDRYLSIAISSRRVGEDGLVFIVT
ncbi:MAG: hypothetical protein AAF998_19610 [Bacteroidota bacterium]